MRWERFRSHINMNMQHEHYISNYISLLFDFPLPTARMFRFQVELSLGAIVVTRPFNGAIR